MSSSWPCWPCWRCGGGGRSAPTVLGEALGLRRGEPLAEFSYAGFFDAERAHLGELILVAIESRAGADLGLGRHGELAGELEALCREHPLRERLWELLIVALYRSGRQAGALRAYAEIRDRLAGELGIDPGPALRELQARILAQDPSLARPARLRLRWPAEGDLAGALELLNEAERLYTGDMFPDVRPVPALKARVWIAQGSLGEALGWAREQGLSVDDDHGPAIARELVVSLNTVRTHTKNIYAKLAVTSRRAAVRRAAELGLPQTRNRQP